MSNVTVTLVSREKLSPEVIAIVEMWEAAATATFDYMTRVEPPEEGFNADSDVICEVGMMAAIAMTVPFIHDADSPRQMKKLYVKRFQEELTRSLTDYAMQQKAEGKPQ